MMQQAPQEQPSPTGTTDLDAQIAAAELTVIERDARVRADAHAVLDRIRTHSGPGLALGAGVTVLALTGVVLLLRRLVLPRAGSYSRSGSGHSYLPYVLGLFAPLLAQVVRRIAPEAGGSQSGSLSEVLLGLAMPSLGTTLARRSAALEPSEHAELPPVRAAQQVDLRRYLGHWYEIARLPTRYERHCVSDVSATYTLHSTRGLVAVQNRCRETSGRLRSARGVAHVVRGSANARLKVSFAPALLRPLPIVWSDYWVLEVDADYRYALVGTPDRRSLWILARAPTLPASDYEHLIEQARAQGYATSKLIFTTQGEA